MALTIPDEVLTTARLTEEELLKEIAILLFQQEKFTLAQASHLAQLPRIEFQKLLASRRNLRVIGVLGVLLAAKSKGYVSAVQPIVDDLRNRAGFWISQAVYQQILELAKES